MLKKLFFVLFLIIFLLFIPVKIPVQNVFTFWTVQLKAPAGDIIQKNIDYFQNLHPDIKIVWVDIPIAEAQKRAIAAILSGNPPDLINLNPEYSTLLAQKNLLENFENDDVIFYNRALVEKLTFNQKIFALPFYATSAVTIYNKEKFKNYSVPKTYDDILKLKNAPEKPVYGISLNEGDNFSKILNKYSANSVEDFEYVYYLFDNLRAENLLLSDTLTLNHREILERYMSHGADFITAGANFISMIEQNAPDVYSISDVAPQITGKNGQFDISLMNFVIPRHAKNKTLAKEFLQILLNEENQLEFAKKTNVLPANIKALSNSYFKVCDSDLSSKARCLAAKQLDNPLKSDFGYMNKKQIDEKINLELEKLFLNGKKDFSPSELFYFIEKLRNG